SRLLVADKKRAAEAARSVLPNAAETRLFWTANIAELRYILLKRGDPPADLEMRRFAAALFRSFYEAAIADARAAEAFTPIFQIFFEDFELVKNQEWGTPAVVPRSAV